MQWFVFTLNPWSTQRSRQLQTLQILSNFSYDCIETDFNSYAYASLQSKACCLTQQHSKLRCSRGLLQWWKELIWAHFKWEFFEQASKRRTYTKLYNRILCKFQCVFNIILEIEMILAWYILHCQYMYSSKALVIQYVYSIYRNWDYSFDFRMEL